MMRIVLNSLIFTFLAVSLTAQSQQQFDIAADHIRSSAKELHLDATDVQNFSISSAYTSKHNNVTHYYLMQEIDGVPVKNATFGCHLKDGEVFHMTHRAQANIVARANASNPSIEVEDAIASAAQILGYNVEEPLEVMEVTDRDVIYFKPTKFSQQKIYTKLFYYAADEEIKLVWEVDLDIPGTDYIAMMIDAHTGAEIERLNYTVYCSVDHLKNGAHAENCSEKPVLNLSSESTTTTSVTGSYRVYPAPLESPLEGSHDLVVDPAHPDASPFGWHDIDGVEGPEYTITQGNNVHAFLDKDADDLSDGGEPDGGVDLVFDFPHDQLGEPVESDDAAQVNLFYFNNYIHDFAYQFGFDEVSGNFQQKNYTGEGFGNDYVLAQSSDGSGTNNANFSTPTDGNNGAMQMYLWGVSPDNILEVSGPDNIAGFYLAVGATFGGPVTEDPISGKIVLSDDGTAYPTAACNPLINGDEIAGNIALIDRGDCNFDSKCFHAEEQGAIAAIVCNIVGVNGGDGEEMVSMGGDGTPDVGITCIFTGYSTCQKIKAALFEGESVEVNIGTPVITGPENLDASFDNGVIAHEFGHGISNRLTGGPNNSFCLGNDEQMGEGWSDYVTLVSSAKAEDLAEDPRGIGNYVDGKDINGGGIRDYPYSTNMDISPKTYSDIVGTAAPHPLGEVWAVTLWDLYWAFVDEYGYDADLSNTESGNFRAIQLVMDGMKLQPCSPGFLDGRDGILAADVANYDGVHQCMIWEVFARRGMGYFADQGSSNNRGDGTENFDPYPFCIKELKLTREMDGFLPIGGEATVNVQVVNHKGIAATNVVVTDELANGLSYVDGSSTIAVISDGNSLTWELGTMEDLDTITFSYSVLSTEDNYSIGYFVDDFELGDGQWDYFTNPNEGTSAFWEIVTSDFFSETNSFFIEEVVEETDNSIFLIDGVTLEGESPALKFYHKYNTEAGADAGFVSVREVGEQGWTRLTNDHAIRNGYNSNIQYGTFAIPSLVGFSGNTDDQWIDSYFDLSDWAGKEVQVQFRYGTDDNTIVDNGLTAGWFVDDVEFVDVFSYNTQACATSDEGDNVCAANFSVIESKFISDVSETEVDDYNLTISPNPASGAVSIDIQGIENESAEVTLMSINGKMIMSRDISIFPGNNNYQFDLTGVASGVYTVSIVSENHTSIKKLIVK